MAPAAAASAPLYDDRTEVGQRGAIERVCDALPADAAVLLVDQRAAREWPAAIRTSCAVPASGVKDSAPRTLERLAAKVSAAGRAPVLLAADSPIAITAAGLTPHQVVDLRMTEDARLLTRRPTRTVPLRVAVWLAFPDRCLPDRCRDGSPASVRSGDAATPAQARSAAGSLLPAGRER